MRLRVLLVDDFEPWRHFLVLLLREQPELEVIAEVSDGLEALVKAQQLRPDLILLDIGLPKLNGIEVARQLRTVSPDSEVVFISQESSADVVQEALSTGARGYVVKTNASDLMTALNAALRRSPVHPV